MRTNLLNGLSNVVKKGAGLACSWSQVGRMSEEGAIEHPLSTHSAPFGTRWKNRGWKYVACMLVVLFAGVGNVWGGTGSTEIIKNTITAQTTCSVTGTMAGSGAVDKLGSKSPYKLNSDGAYVSLVLSAGNYYAAGDSIVVDADKAIQIYTGTAGSGSLLATTQGPIGGVVVYVLPSSLPSNTSSIYIPSFVHIQRFVDVCVCSSPKLV